MEGDNRRPREASSTKLQAGFVANQDFLGFWTVDIYQESCSQRSAAQKLRVPIVHTENWAAGMEKVIRHTPNLGVTVLTKHLVTWAAWTWEGHKMQAQPSLHLCGVPENMNLSCLDLGSTRNPGPASDSSRHSNLEPEKCRIWKHTCREQG